MDLLDALDLATDEFGRRLGLVTADQWTAATPCEEWDVTFLLAHVVGGNRFAAMVLQGATAEEAVTTVLTQPQLSADPSADFAATVAEQRTVFRTPDRLDATVDHPVGVITGHQFLTFRVFDITLHAWDLATAIGADTTLAPNLVETVLAIVSPSGGVGFGAGPLGEVGVEGSPQDRLLDLTGRRGR